jgi:hypothetical protein
MAAAPPRDYVGAAILFSVAAIAASYIYLSPFETPFSGSRRAVDLLKDFTLIGSAGVSAALSCRLLRPLARRLARHQYLLRPLTMGFLVVLVAHLLLGVVASSLFLLLSVLPLGANTLVPVDQGFEVGRFFGSILLMGIGGFVLASFATVPAGILAAYCVEVFGGWRPFPEAPAWERPSLRARRC